LVCHWSMDYQLSQLKADGWQRWEAAIAATPYSVEEDLHPGTTYSKDLINQAYHLLMWERCTGDRVEWLDSIAEVGGGYGALALVCHRLGFRGTYTVYDLPEFSLLQRWFLGQLGVEARCVTRLNRRRQEADLLVGIYSLSEMTLARRKQILDAWPAASYLLVYSSDWQEYDNRDWFAAWAAGLGDYRWWYWRMERENNRPDYYRVGAQSP